jgi:hypothetical protein
VTRDNAANGYLRYFHVYGVCNTIAILLRATVLARLQYHDLCQESKDEQWVGNVAHCVQRFLSLKLAVQQRKDTEIRPWR